MLTLRKLPCTLAVVETEGNPACHVILRGANSGPNYEVEHVKKAAEGLKKAGVSTRVMIDWYAAVSSRRLGTREHETHSVLFSFRNVQLARQQQKEA